MCAKINPSPRKQHDVRWLNEKPQKSMSHHSAVRFSYIKPQENNE